MLLLFGDEEDETRDSVEDLAAAFPRAMVRLVPGDHGAAPRSPEFTAALIEFLGDRGRYSTFSIARSTSWSVGFSCSVSLPPGPSSTIAMP